MLCVIRCLLFVVCLLVVCCSLCVLCCSLFVVRCSLFVVRCVLFACSSCCVVCCFVSLVVVCCVLVVSCCCVLFVVFVWPSLLVVRWLLFVFLVVFHDVVRCMLSVVCYMPFGRVVVCCSQIVGRRLFEVCC